MKLMHLADVHLGVRALGFGDRAEDLRSRIEMAFRRSLQIAAERNCSLVLISGDLFDSNRVGQRTLRTATQAMEEFLTAAPSAHLLLIPGNHDPWEDGGIYHSAEFASLGERFHLLTDVQGQTVHFPHLDTAVHGVPFARDYHQTAPHPLQMLKPDPAAVVNVAMLHAGVPAAHWDGTDAPTVTTEQIAASGMDYVALGHFHNCQVCDAGGVVARYPGPVELINLKSPPGAPLVVDISPSGITVEQVPVASLKLETVEILAAQLASEGDLVAQLTERAGADVVLKAAIVGMLPLEVRLESEQVSEELADRFYRLVLEDHTEVSAAQIDATEYPENMVIGKYLRLLQERIEKLQQDGDEQQLRVAQQALRLGMHLLKGGDLR